MDLNLKGTKVAITGASEGIGRAIAVQLGGEGCDLFLTARSADKLAAAKAEIEEANGVSVETFPLDLSKSENQQAFADACKDKAEILVNNAGAVPKGRLDELDEATVRAAWDLKLFGYINLTREFYAAMKARRRGVILNIIGNGGERPVSDYIIGATSNAALMAFTRGMGGDSTKDGIRVLAINPGPVETERVAKMMRKSAEDQLGDAERYREMYGRFPFERAATCQEVATMAAFLVSDLSAYTSGTVVTIDGGMHNRGPLF